MKTPEEYLEEGLEKYRQENGKGMEEWDKVALEAIRVCLQDHDEFVKEQLKMVNNLVLKTGLMKESMDRITRLLP